MNHYLQILQVFCISWSHLNLHFGWCSQIRMIWNIPSFRPKLLWRIGSFEKPMSRKYSGSSLHRLFCVPNTYSTIALLQKSRPVIFHIIYTHPHCVTLLSISNDSIALSSDSKRKAWYTNLICLPLLRGCCFFSKIQRSRFLFLSNNRWKSILIQMLS